MAPPLVRPSPAEALERRGWGFGPGWLAAASWLSTPATRRRLAALAAARAEGGLVQAQHVRQVAAALPVWLPRPASLACCAPGPSQGLAPIPISISSASSPPRVSRRHVTSSAGFRATPRDLSPFHLPQSGRHRIFHFRSFPLGAAMGISVARLSGAERQRSAAATLSALSWRQTQYLSRVARRGMAWWCGQALPGFVRPRGRGVQQGVGRGCSSSTAAAQQHTALQGRPCACETAKPAPAMHPGRPLGRNVPTPPRTPRVHLLLRQARPSPALILV